MNGTLCERDMSEKLGCFNPSQLVYFPHLTLIDISGSTFVDAKQFVDTCVYCPNIQELSIQGCVQFHEDQIMTMMCALKELQIIDCSVINEITHVTAEVIIVALRLLCLFNFDPKYSKEQIFVWKKLVQKYNKVKFGHNVMGMFPYNGQYLRIANDDVCND